MITAEELRQLLADLGTDRVERTTSTTDTDTFAKAVAAFSNDLPDHRRPGYLLIGARDDGSLCGLQASDEFLRNLAGLRSDGNIRPLPSITVARISLPDGDVAVVEVFPSDLPPVHYKGRIWIRTGPRSAIASEGDERRLTEKRVSHARTFDALPCRDAMVDDLAPELFRLSYLPKAVAPDVLALNHRSFDAQLSSLHFWDPKVDCPTNAGVLLFGRDPLRWLPGAYVQFLRFAGDSPGNVLEEKRVSGDLLTLLRDLDSLAKLQVESRPVPISLLQEASVFNYPAVALRELLMNAIMHRSYESTAPVRFYRFTDRLEIQSPGGLYGDVSPSNFPNQNSYRNPILAEAMKTLGYVNRFGTGVMLAQAALEANQNRPAKFEFDPGYVKVTLWPRK